MILRFDVETNVDHCLLTVRGSIGEIWPEGLAELPDNLSSKKIIINLEAVEGVNSFGIRNWITFIRRISKNMEIVYQSVPSCIVQQLNVIPEILGKASIASFQVDFQCEDCGEEKTIVMSGDLTDEQAKIEIEKIECDECHVRTFPQSDTDSYFTFLSR